jgi:hypothetical protein
MRLRSNDRVPSSLLWIGLSTACVAIASKAGEGGETALIAIAILAAWILLASRIPKVLSRPAFIPF